METLDAYDLTGSFRDAGELAGCPHNTVARYVAERDAGRGAGGSGMAARPQLIDEFTLLPGAVGISDEAINSHATPAARGCRANS